MTAISRTTTPPDELSRWAHQVLVAATAGTHTPPDWLRRRLDAGLGGVCLFGRNVIDTGQVRTFTDALRQVRSDVLVAIDEEGGDVTRLHRDAGSPSLGHLALAAVGDLELTRCTAAAIGTELRDAGVDWDFAPVADVNASPDSPVIGVRSFGSDPREVGRQVAAYVAGLADAGIASCAKHFPGHGATSADSHTALPRIDVGRAELDAVHLPPFRDAIAAGVDTVMLGHLLVTCLDADLPASLSGPCARLLRDDLGFDGVIVTDALEMQAVAGTWTIPGAAVLAIAAGADALCLSGELHDDDVVEACVRALVEAVRGGRLAPSRLAEAAGRMASFAARRTDRRRPAPGSAASGSAAPGSAASGIELEILARSVRVRGEPAVGPGPLDVIGYQPEPNIAAGRSPWDPAAELAGRRPGSTVRRVDEQTQAGPVVDAEPRRPVIAVVRDLHRHPWAQTSLHRLLAARPDAVIVELGVPILDPGGRAWVCTHGAGAASVATAADLLALGGSAPGVR